MNNRSPQNTKPPRFFINRRSGRDRRNSTDPCKNMQIDMYHRKRRKSADRRGKLKTLEDDYYAYIQIAESAYEDRVLI